MSNKFQLPTVNEFHHNNMKVGALESIIFDLQRTSDPAVTPEKRALWLANAEKAKAAAQERVDKLVGFEPPNRYLDNVEEIVARQEVWDKYWEETLEAEVLKEVFNYTKPTIEEQRAANGEESAGDLQLD